MIITLTCKNSECGRTFEVHKNFGGSLPDYCPLPECQNVRSDKRREQERDWKRKQRGTGLTYEIPRPCEHCGQVFTPDRNVHHGLRTWCYEPDCEDAHAEKRRVLQKQAVKLWETNKAMGTNPRGLRGANKRKDQAPKKSRRRCIDCGKDPAPNILRCPACHTRICNSGIDYDMGLYV